MKHGKPLEIPGNNQVLNGEINPEFYSKSHIQVLFCCYISLSQILFFLLSEIKKVCISFLCKEGDICEHFVTEVSEK
jgi:hypothetical protein